MVRQVESQYLRTQGILESRIAAKKKIQTAPDDFHKNCHSKLKVEIDWKIFESAQQKTTPGMAYAYLTSFSRVCMIDKDHLAAVKKSSDIRITPIDYYRQRSH